MGGVDFSTSIPFIYNKSPRFIYTKTYTPQKNMGPFCHPLFRGVPQKNLQLQKNS